MSEPVLEKIDTQGMTGPATPEAIANAINEVLDEREGKMDYQSYFDLDGREYPVV